MGLTKKDLMIPALSISVADNNSLELIGAHFMHISATSGEVTKQLVYFAMDVGEFYLSKAALIDLKIIPHDFPRIGAWVATDYQGPANAGKYTRYRASSRPILRQAHPQVYFSRTPTIAREF